MVNGQRLTGLQSYETVLRANDELSGSDTFRSMRLRFLSLPAETQNRWGRFQESAVPNSGHASQVYAFYRYIIEDGPPFPAHGGSDLLSEFLRLSEKERNAWNWVSEQLYKGFPLTSQDIEDPATEEEMEERHAIPLVTAATGLVPRCTGCGRVVGAIHHETCVRIGPRQLGEREADREVLIGHTGRAPEPADQAPPFMGCVSCHEGIGSLHRPDCPRSIGNYSSPVLVSESTDIRRWKPIPADAYMGVPGIKDDELKLEYHLLPIRALQEVVGVLMYGKEKYAENNWIKVENPFVRYFNAALRHLWDSRHEDFDPETGFSHYAHAVCCVLFMLALKVDSVFDYEILRKAMEKGRKVRMEREKRKAVTK